LQPFPLLSKLERCQKGLSHIRINRCDILRWLQAGGLQLIPSLPQTLSALGRSWTFCGRSSLAPRRKKHALGKCSRSQLQRSRRFLDLVTCLSDSFWKQQQTPGCSKEAEVQRRFGRLVGGRRIGFGRFGTSRGQCLGFRLQTSSDYVQELVAEDEEVLLLERLEPAIVEAINESIRSRDETHRR
jgi:hypothetical protein